MTTITLKTTEAEKEIIKEYAKLNGMSVNQFIKTNILEMIENEYDYKSAEKAYREFLESGKETVSFDTLLKQYGIE